MSTMLREILLFCIAAYPLICGSSFPSARDLMTAKERAHNAASLIFNRFELQYLPNQQLFMSLFNIPPRTWNLLKYKMINKIIGGHANFTIVYGGTAVTAGYDNYLHQSYPMVFQRRVKPIFEAVGVNLDVRNFGQSHVDCRLLNFCTANALAHQADVVGWENSFDCGNAKDAHETIARIAGWRGAVVMYMVSGSFPLENCPPSTVDGSTSPVVHRISQYCCYSMQDKVPYISEEWSPEKVGIDYRYEPTALDVQDFRDLHVLWHSQGSSGARFTASLEGKYEVIFVVLCALYGRRWHVLLVNGPAGCGAAWIQPVDAVGAGVRHLHNPLQRHYRPAARREPGVLHRPRAGTGTIAVRPAPHGERRRHGHPPTLRRGKAQGSLPCSRRATLANPRGRAVWQFPEDRPQVARVGGHAPAPGRSVGIHVSAHSDGCDLYDRGGHGTGAGCLQSWRARFRQGVAGNFQGYQG